MLDFGQRENMPMAEETTLHFLVRRKRELSAQISALKGQLVPKEDEFAHIEHMLGLFELEEIGHASELLSSSSPAAEIPGPKGYIPTPEEREMAKKALEQLHNTPSAADILTSTIDALKKCLPSPEADRAIERLMANVREIMSTAQAKYEKMTIKELAIQALLDQFPNGGTLADIRDFIRDGYGRTIEPSSFRPQMHRLKQDGILGQDPSTDTWNFRDKKRSLYAMYNHPTSRAAMKELKDDEISDNEPRTQLRDLVAPEHRDVTAQPVNRLRDVVAPPKQTLAEKIQKARERGKKKDDFLE